jgi:signal transduction histidine kinase
LRPKVLTVDDEPEFLEIEKLYLAKHRMDVTPCESARVAVDELKSGNYDVVVSDYQMPVLNGLDLLKILKEDGYDLGFILLTGRGREDVAINALNEGADYYIQKGPDMPSQFALLARTIEDICMARESSGALAESARALAESENLLRISNQRLDLLGSITRHDIRGEVSIAGGYIGLAEKETDPARTRQHLLKAKTAIEKITGIIEIARTYQINGTMNIKWASLHSALERAIGSVDIHDVTYTNTSEDWTILVDPLLEMVCGNIFSNSIRHGKSVSKIQVSSRERADGLDLIIEDDGVGIAPEEKDHIFNFLTPAGVPHGLSIAKRILEAEQIKIEETGAHGKGARFILHFPAGLYRMKPGVPPVNGNHHTPQHS